MWRGCCGEPSVGGSMQSARARPTQAQHVTAQARARKLTLGLNRRRHVPKEATPVGAQLRRVGAADLVTLRHGGARALDGERSVSLNVNFGRGTVALSSTRHSVLCRTRAVDRSRGTVVFGGSFTGSREVVGNEACGLVWCPLGGCQCACCVQRRTQAGARRNAPEIFDVS